MQQLFIRSLCAVNESAASYKSKTEFQRMLKSFFINPNTIYRFKPFPLVIDHYLHLLMMRIRFLEVSMESFQTYYFCQISFAGNFPVTAVSIKFSHICLCYCLLLIYLKHLIIVLPMSMYTRNSRYAHTCFQTCAETYSKALPDHVKSCHLEAAGTCLFKHCTKCRTTNQW